MSEDNKLKPSDFPNRPLANQSHEQFNVHRKETILSGEDTLRVEDLDISKVERAIAKLRKFGKVHAASILTGMLNDAYVQIDATENGPTTRDAFVASRAIDREVKVLDRQGNPTFIYSSDRPTIETQNQSDLEAIRATGGTLPEIDRVGEVGIFAGIRIETQRRPKR